jgi:hypothetical protein
MATGFNWRKINQRATIDQRGWEAHDGSSSSFVPLTSFSSGKPRPRQPSKADLRAEGARAVQEFERRRVRDSKAQPFRNELGKTTPRHERGCND